MNCPIKNTKMPPLMLSQVAGDYVIDMINTKSRGNSLQALVVIEQWLFLADSAWCN